MPGSARSEGPAVMTSADLGLRESKTPLPYLRSRNALKIILDLDENFGRPRVPMGQGWVTLEGPMRGKGR